MKIKTVAAASLTPSRIFTTGQFYNDTHTIALKYCYPVWNKAGTLIWRTRVWAYCHYENRAKITMLTIKLRSEGMIYFPKVKHGQSLSVYQHRTLINNGLLGRKQPNKG